MVGGQLDASKSTCVLQRLLTLFIRTNNFDLKSVFLTLHYYKRGFVPGGTLLVLVLCREYRTLLYEYYEYRTYCTKLKDEGPVRSLDWLQYSTVQPYCLL